MSPPQKANHPAMKSIGIKRKATRLMLPELHDEVDHDPRHGAAEDQSDQEGGDDDQQLGKGETLLALHSVTSSAFAAMSASRRALISAALAAALSALALNSKVTNAAMERAAVTSSGVFSSRFGQNMR